MLIQARMAQLVREAGRVTVQHLAGYERQRRHATLLAVSLDLATTLTDQAMDLFERLIGGMFRRAEGGVTSRFAQNRTLSRQASNPGLSQTEVCGRHTVTPLNLAIAVAKPSFKTRLKGKLFVHGSCRAVLSKR